MRLSLTEEETLCAISELWSNKSALPKSENNVMEVRVKGNSRLEFLIFVNCMKKTAADL